MRAESMREPEAALASVLARIILACSIALGGRSPYRVWLRNRASLSARPGETVALVPFCCLSAARAIEGHAAAMPTAPPPAIAPRNRSRRFKMRVLVNAILALGCSEQVTQASS